MSILNIFVDGGSRGNPGPGASAFVVYDSRQNLVYSEGKFLGPTTNNVAEYQAVINALTWLKEFRLNHKETFEINIHSDSQLLIYQVKGLYKIKNHKLQQMIIKLFLLQKEINSSINFKLIRREKNTQADKLVNDTLNNQTV